MSYFTTTDEKDEEELREELEYREKERNKGVCDYCGRSPDTKSCKFPKRHHDDRIRKVAP